MCDIQPGVLFIKAPLEGYLVDENVRGIQTNSFVGFQGAIEKEFTVFYERVHFCLLL